MEQKTGPDDAGRRLDKVCRKLFSRIPLGKIYSSIRKGEIKINGKKKGQSYRIMAEDILSAPDHFFPTAKNIALPKKERPFIDLSGSILFENNDYLVINKPAGVLTHGAGSVKTFVDTYLGEIRKRSLAFSPAPLHRLDRNTSGIIVCGKSIEGTEAFTRGLREKQIIKGYLGIIEGDLVEEVLWEDPIERNKQEKKTVKTRKGHRAILSAFPLTHSGGHTLAIFVPLTGKTHQIRIQSSIHGFPLKNDNKYGGKKQSAQRYFLHALFLQGKSLQPSFPPQAAPIPPPFESEIKTLFSGYPIPFHDPEAVQRITDKITSIYRNNRVS